MIMNKQEFYFNEINCIVRSTIDKDVKEEYAY
ncbi:hypothetical protein H4683_003876 [Filibacter limicola]|uniref:Uncharacterized protein n=1 Tax=Sporosarcina limicola TaxID=34101 RepID=A0A927MLV6_9BACL|nr:hypothetical protein [Sporosarcina limicola]